MGENKGGSGFVSRTTYAHTDAIDMSRNTVNCLCGGGNLALPNTFNRLKLDLSGSGFMSITQLVGLAQYASDAMLRGVPREIIRPRSSIESYLMRMNLYRLIGIEGKEGFHRHDPNGRFVPMLRLDNDESHQIATDMVHDVILAHLPAGNWDPGTILNLSLSEVMGNIPVHANSPSDGIVGAQYYPKMGIVEICVADSGQGIVASMGKNTEYSGMNPEQMMRCALEEGYGQYYGDTTFSGIHTSGGRGLMYPTRLTRALDGRMWVISHNYALEVSGSGVEMLTGLSYPGTLVSMRLPVNPNAKIFADDIFTGAKHVLITWTEDGWLDSNGMQVDVYGLTGSDNGLW